MSNPESGAQVASRRSLVPQSFVRSHPFIRRQLVLILAAVCALTTLASLPGTAAASSMKVVIIVGPVGSKTADYISDANAIADQVASYGARVYKIYSPNATWDRVHTYAQGANLLVYLGHGNGWPSPYCCFQRYTKDGFGLNATANNGNDNVKYYGEYYIDRNILLAHHAVVLLARLCYASGNPEWGGPTPSTVTAIERVDNFASGFLHSSAGAVFAIGITSPASILQQLFKTNRTMSNIFLSASDATNSYKFAFHSTRTTGTSGILDPYKPGQYYRSVAGWLNMTSAQFRAG